MNSPSLRSGCLDLPLQVLNFTGLLKDDTTLLIILSFEPFDLDVDGAELFAERVVLAFEILGGGHVGSRSDSGGNQKATQDSRLEMVLSRIWVEDG